MLNLRHTLDSIYLTSILEVQCPLHYDDKEIVYCSNTLTWRQAIMQSIICTHHRRHFNNASNVSVLPGYICNRLQILNSGSWLLSHYLFDWGAILLTLNHACCNSKISWSLETARFAFRLLQSVWNLTGTSAAVLPRCLSNITTIRSL